MGGGVTCGEAAHPDLSFLVTQFGETKCVSGVDLDSIILTTIHFISVAGRLLFEEVWDIFNATEILHHRTGYLAVGKKDSVFE